MFCNNCGIEIPNNSKFCFNCGAKQIVSIIENESLLFEEDLYKLKVLIDSKKSEEIINHLNEIIKSKENAEVILLNYSKLFNRDLLGDLINLSTRYDRIKSYVQKFIDFTIIESEYPHKIINKRIEPVENWKEKALNPKKEKSKVPILIIVAIVAIIIYYLSNPNDTSNVQLVSVGDRVEVGHFAYRVNQFEYTKSIGSYFSERADGIFILINLSLVNKDNEAHTLDNSFFRLQDENGKIYETSIDGSTALEMNGLQTLFLKQCNPNVQKQGYLIFEVPKNEKYYLQLSGGFLTKETALVELN